MGKFFGNITSLEELKKEYRKLCFLHHPDRGGDTETMKFINSEYDNLFENLKHNYNENRGEHQRECNEMPHEYREILEKLIILEGLEIELCGAWLWLSGETKKYKEMLKENGCKWANKKMMWYWYPEGYEAKSRGNYGIDKIRAIHGSEIIKGGPKPPPKLN